MSYIRGTKKSFTTLLMNARVLQYTYDRGSLFFLKFICIHMLMTIYDVNVFTYTYCHL